MEREKMYCHSCGREIDYGDEMEFEGEYYCNDCVSTCDECGQLYPKDFMLKSGRYEYCPSCTVTCSHCGEVVPECDAVELGCGSGVVCDHCADAHYYRCDDCGEYYTLGDVYTDDYDNVVCDRCYNRYSYRTCDECGRITMDWYTSRDGYYCEYCDGQRCGIMEYGEKPEPIFHGCTDLHLGVELEVDGGDSGELDFVRWIDCEHSDLMYCKEDGSLSEVGVEIVTHPCSLEYHLNDFPWDELSKRVRDENFISHNTSTCGLHVHASRDFFGPLHTNECDFAVARLIIIVSNLFDDYLFPFSRRKSGSINQWASKNYVAPNDDKSDESKCYDIIDCNDDRYRAVNICNCHTVEFRLFRGTLKVNTIKATLQLVDKLCRYAKECTLDQAYNVKWENIASDMPVEFNQYCAERGLPTYTALAA